LVCFSVSFFFFQAEDGIRDFHVTGVQTCALPILHEQETRQLLIPVEVPLGNAMWAQNTEAAVEDQPGLGDFQQCRGQVDVLAARSEERRVEKGRGSRWTAEN